MAEDKVEVQMQTDRSCERSMRYAAIGQGASEVCRTIYIEKHAFDKIGQPDVIRVTIEAVRMLGSKYAG